ncbi:MAG: class I SAM-dependent methyltransferase [Chloroflexota bacterium]
MSNLALELAGGAPSAIDRSGHDRAGSGAPGKVSACAKGWYDPFGEATPGVTVRSMVTSAYDAIAEWYDAWVGTGSMRDDPFFPTVEALMGEIGGLTVCDLACGQGRVARYLAGLGARVVGVDLSAKLLAIARRHEEAEPRGVAYLQADARQLDGIVDAAFDGLICHLALMDIADLAPTLRGIARILKPAGWLVFSILHPCYNSSRSGEIESPEGIARVVAGYFTEGYWRSETRTGPPGKVGAYHRTLSTYVNTLADVGLALDRVAEPRATGIAAEKRPVWAEVPAVLVVRCQKV